MDVTAWRWLLVLALGACGRDPRPAAPDGSPADVPPASPIARDHGSSIAVSRDGTRVYVVNADSDSVSILDAQARTLVAEIALGPAPMIAGDGSFTPAVMPRALALAPSGDTLYVTGQRAGRVFAIDLATRAVTSAVVGSEPIGVVATDGAIYVACSADRAIVELDAHTLGELARTPLDAAPWALGWTTDGALAATLFQGPGAVVLDPDTLAITARWSVPDVAPRGDARLAHGVPRGFYDLAARPGSDEVWLVHTLLGIDTAQPELDFERTAFPAISIIPGGGIPDGGISAGGGSAAGVITTLSTDAQDVPGLDGSIGDVVSGPHAIAFTHDGELALVVDTNSEDVLAIGANRVEAALQRPLPGHLPEGIAISPDDQVAYIDERNTGDVAVVRIVRSTAGVRLELDGAPISRLAADPMPTQLRLGQHLFYSANSDEYPITQNHWIACATCHLEGRSDQVTWRFAQGPRDTPSNAGGTLGTGFLFRTADRTRVQDYWHTINLEQGGAFAPGAQAALLDALAAYVDHAIPLPVPPTTDPAKVARGAAIFARAEVGCATCHAGPHFTDSGSGNPALDLAGPIVLHDVGTCAAGDVAHEDVAGHPRAPCLFDTPSLAGVWSTPPYFHDGRAATLRDALELTRGTMGDITMLSDDDLDALVEYLRSL